MDGPRLGPTPRCSRNYHRIHVLQSWRMRCVCAEWRHRGGRHVYYTSNTRREGQEGTRSELRNVRQIPCSEAPLFAALLRAFFAGQHSMERRHGKRLMRLSLGPLEDIALWSADTVSGWLLDVSNAVQCHPLMVLVGCRTSSAKGLLPLPTPLVLA